MLHWFEERVAECVAVCYSGVLLLICPADHDGGMLQCVEVCCSVLQCVDVCCSELKCVAVC